MSRHDPKMPGQPGSIADERRQLRTASVLNFSRNDTRSGS